MAPREANNPFADQYLSIEYDATTMMLPHDIGLGNMDDEEEEPEEEQEEEEEQVADPQGQLEHDDDHDENPIVGHPTRNHGILSPATTAIHLQQQQQQLQSPHFNDDDGYFHLTNPPVAADLNTPATNATTTTTMNAPIATGFDHVPTNHYNHGSGSAGDNPVGGRGATQPLPFEVHVQSTEHSIAQQQRRRSHDPPFPIASSPSHGSDVVQDVDPLAIDMSDPEEQDAWNLYLDAAIASASENCILHTSRNNTSSPQARVRERSQTASFPSRSFEFPTRRRATSDGISSLPNVRRSFPQDASGARLSQHPRTNRIQRFSRRRVSLLDQDPSMSCSEDEQDGLPDLDTTHDESAATTTSGQDLDGSEVSSPPGTPHFMSLDESGGSSGSPATRNVGSAMSSSAAGNRGGGLSFVAPVRRMFRGETNLFHSSNTNAVVEGVNVVSDEDNTSSGSSFTTQNPNNVVGSSTMMMEHPTTPRRFVSSSTVRSISALSTGSGPSIHWNGAFDSGSTGSSANHNDSDASSVVNSAASFGNDSSPSPSPTQLNLSFGPHTTITDLKYFAERGCIVPLLGALDTPRLKTMGARMLADYAKLPHRRVAVASNKRILEFCCRTMLELPTEENMGTDWPAREYAVEAIRSLTATEDSDGYLMKCNGLLKSLAVVARGGPFGTIESLARTHCQMTPGMGLVSGKARLHACIAIMNLSCGKANKIEIASIPEVLEAMRDVMMAQPENFSPATSSQVHSSNGNVTPKNVAAEARLKAATCIKNLSNADKNDAALLNADGLLEALAHVAVISCSGEKGATNCTTNACLALMNLSISKANKHKVFKTPGVMNALMEVLERTSPRHGRRGEKNDEARIKACSALSNLAIGYENKIPMFNYPGFVGCILDVIQTDSGEARTKACSILWSFAAEMKNQVPVVQRGDILPVLVRVAAEDHSTEARFKCVAALTLLAESLDNAMPLLESGALHPLMDILHDAGPDPTQWKGQTASWCVGFLMNMSQSDEAAPYLREAGVVELLAPLLTLDHYQSLKAAMAVTFVCRYDEDDETYDLLRKTENVIPKIINLLHNTLAGMGGSGYKYGVFTLRSSVGCISSLASGPEFMKERISTRDVFESLLRVVSDFCVDGGTDGAIVGGGRDDAHSATLAIRALQALTEYLIPIPGSSALPFGATMDSPLMTALDSFASCTHPGVADKTRELARDAFHRIQSSLDLSSCPEDSDSGSEGYSRRRHPEFFIENSIVASLVQGCCIGPSLQGGFEDSFFPSMIRTTQNDVVLHGSNGSDEGSSQLSGAGRSQGPIRTFLLTDARTGRRFAVPTDPSGGRAFNDGRLWCYRRGRFCKPGEIPDPDYQWNEDLQNAYLRALGSQQEASSSTSQSRLNNSGSGASQIQSQRIPYV